MELIVIEGIQITFELKGNKKNLKIKGSDRLDMVVELRLQYYIQ